VVEVKRSQPPTLTFADTRVGSTSADSPQSVTFQNIGNQSLNAVTPGLVITGPDFVQGGSGPPLGCFSGLSLVPGASCDLSISFKPTAAGPLQSAAVFTDNALNANPATQSVILKGTGTLVATTTSAAVNDAATNSAWTGLEVTGASAYASSTVTGGATPTGTVTYSFYSNGTCSGSPASTSQQTLSSGTVPNSASFGPLAAGTYSFIARYSGDSNHIGSASSCAHFTVNRAPTTTTLGSSMNPSNAGQSVTFTATVHGIVVGFAATGTVSFTSNGNPLCLPVLSSGTAQCTTTSLPAGSDTIVATYSGDSNYQGSPSGPLTQVVQSRVASFSPASFSFGDVQVDTRVVKSVILKNTGNAPLTIFNILLDQAGGPPDFATVFTLTSHCPASLAAGKSCTITVTLFDSTDAVDVTDNALDSPQHIPLSANVTQLDIGFKPGSLSFAQTSVGSSVKKTATITNLSNATMSLNAIAITGANAGDFTQTNNCPSVLQPGGHCVATITFGPTAAGSRVAGLMVTANGGSTQQTLPLSGTGQGGCAAESSPVSSCNAQ
jgi:hypothetical protein